MKPYNIYDELSDAESSILKMAEQGFSNHRMAAVLNMSYGSLCVLKSEMRKRGIYIHNMTTRESGLTDEVKEQIIKMDRDGMKNGEIVNILGIKSSTLQLWKRKMRDFGTVLNGNAGRPRTVHKD